MARSTITCPECGMLSEAEMPEDACLYFFVCPSCQTRLKPLMGDCCVFCSYGTESCPPVRDAAVAATNRGATQQSSAPVLPAGQ